MPKERNSTSIIMTQNDLISYNWALAKSLNEADKAQPCPAEFVSSNRNEEGEHGIHHHSPSQEFQRSVFLTKNTEGDLVLGGKRESENGFRMDCNVEEIFVVMIKICVNWCD